MQLVREVRGATIMELPGSAGANPVVCVVRGSKLLAYTSLDGFEQACELRDQADRIHREIAERTGRPIPGNGAVLVGRCRETEEALFLCRDRIFAISMTVVEALLEQQDAFEADHDMDHLSNEEVLEFNALLGPEELVADHVDQEKERLRNSLKLTQQASSGTGSRQRIPDDIKMFVWRRDEGQCVYCARNENLEFDHVIPLAMGGSNTARNLQLLCESCNRQKGAQIA